MEDGGSFPSIDPIGAESHDFLYKVSKLVHDKCLQPLSQINQTDSHIREMRKPTGPGQLGGRRWEGGSVIRAGSFRRTLLSYARSAE